MQDPILNEMLIDFATLLHDLEWWQSGDYEEEQYRKTVRRFKKKWFCLEQETIRQILAEEMQKFSRTVIGP